jgi:hypothetical protein
LAPFFPTPTFFWHHLNSHRTTPWIRWPFPIFLWKLRAKPKPQVFFIPSSWHSNASYIYQQVVLLRWFLNTFGTIFTLKILRVDSLSCSNFVFILHRVMFHPKLHVSLEWPTS